LPVLLRFHGGVSVGVRVRGSGEDAVAEGFRGSFARRYLPLESASVVDELPGDVGAVVEWLWGSGFSVEGYKLSVGDTDIYTIRSGAPEAYTNESPVFFLLQVAARLYAKRGLALFTDTISFADPSNGRAVLILGYPHSGKSTLLALAAAEGYTPLSTENTVVRVDGDAAWVLGGSRVLVVDPRAVERYLPPSSLKPTGRTRHGYLIVDLDDSYSLKPFRVEAIYVIHCSFASSGASFEPVTGRKAEKLLWHFATSLLKGDDFYKPHPLCLDEGVEANVASIVSRMAAIYKGRFYEVFGGHRDVFREIVRRSLEG
jgi:hypothetical protein